jgi:hypothetical protein
MSDTVNESAPCPSIAIPRNFKGATLSEFADDIVSGCPEEGWPPLLELDFQNLNFIRPAGVVFLSNLLWWLEQQGTQVHLINAERDALRYLDDSLFFEQHCGGKVWENSSPRDTTIPLQRIAHSHSHDWLGARRTNEVWALKSGGGDSGTRNGDPPASHRTGLRSLPGTDFRAAETEAENASFCSRRLNTETRKDTKNPYFCRTNATGTNGVRALKTAWWAHQGSNLGPAD